MYIYRIKSRVSYGHLDIILSCKPAFFFLRYSLSQYHSPRFFLSLFSFSLSLLSPCLSSPPLTYVSNSTYLNSTPHIRLSSPSISINSLILSTYPPTHLAAGRRVVIGSPFINLILTSKISIALVSKPLLPSPFGGFGLCILRV